MGTGRSQITSSTISRPALSKSAVSRRPGERAQTDLGVGAGPSSRFNTGACRSRCSRSEEHTSELQSRLHLVCRLLLEKKKHQYDVQSSLTLRYGALNERKQHRDRRHYT